MRGDTDMNTIAKILLLPSLVAMLAMSQTVWATTFNCSANGGSTTVSDVFIYSKYDNNFGRVHSSQYGSFGEGLWIEGLGTKVSDVLRSDDNYVATTDWRFSVLPNCSITQRVQTVSTIIYRDSGYSSAKRKTDTLDTPITIVQSAGTLDFAEASKNFWQVGGRGNVNVSATAGIRWKLVAGDSSWITIDSSDAVQLGTGACGFTVKKNTTGKTRTTTLKLCYLRFKTSGCDFMYNDTDILDKTYLYTWEQKTAITITQAGNLSYSGDETGVKGPVTIDYSDLNGELFEFSANGTVIVSSTTPGSFVWQPTKTGSYSISCKKGTETWTTTLKVTELSYYTQPEPNPPTASNKNITITPTTRNFGVNGGGNAIITQGSGTWTASKSEDWITLNATSGTVGYPVAYTVSATTNVEQRVGYIYVSGNTHTVTQDGVGGTISPENREFESNGGSGTISVSTQNKMLWHARSNVEWISVSATSGLGPGNVTYQVAPFNDVSTRQGTLTVAGNTFTVFQYGKRMKLDSYSVTKDYETHVIPITVNALAATTWSVTPNNSWISVVDAGNGHGGDLVTIAIAENPSYLARTGTVSIGTETFTVTQQGRTALEFSISPATSTASVEGANAIIEVRATPDLPWTATSGVNWCAIYAATASGAGNGNVVYSVSPNPTLSQRTGKITIRANGVGSKTHTVTQPAATAAISSNGYEFEASGESCSVEVSVANIVQWSISESLDWLTVSGSLSRTGPGTVTLQAAANNTIYPRSGTVKIAGKTFTVSQKARGVEVEYDSKLFGTDGGYESISIHPDGNVAWTAVASDTTWITIFQGGSGTGDGEILYIVSPYVGDGTARVGWITVGDKKVYITQRAYDLSISPNGTYVTGNNGAGEFGVSATIGDVWTAIVTEPWITLVSGYDSGTGSGTVRFLYEENTTGKMRTGKIIVNGEVYTLQQRARTMVAITATAEHGGSVSGGGSYDLGTQVTLTAVPDSGYKFSYWTGAASSMQNPLTLTVETAKSYTAVFEPLPIAFTGVESSVDGVALAWNNLAWATTYRIYRGVTSVPSSATVVAELPNDGNCTYLDETGDVDVEYWYWIEAEGVSDEVMSDPMTGRKLKPVVFSPITYTNLRGAANPNPTTYQEGTLVTFSNPGAVTGYTFAGWTPSQITTDMTGAQTVNAAWIANGYSIAYNPNGGSGTMDATAMTYDAEGIVASNSFTWAGHVFAGWATNETGEVVYAAGQTVSNLTAQSSGVVTLYAVWEDLAVASPTVSIDGGDIVATQNGTGTAIFTGDSCEVTLSCATDGAIIYYSPTGATPKPKEANRYKEPIVLSDSAVIKAIAVKDGISSASVTVTVTKRTLSLGEAASADGTTATLSWTTGGDADWMSVAEATAASGFSARSGLIGDDKESWLMLSVTGTGTLTFRYKASCEEDPDGTCTWDALRVYVDDEPRSGLWIDGDSGWVSQSVAFTTDGAHSVKWVYWKDESDFDNSDCAWVSGAVWTPDAAAEPFPEVAANAAPGTVAAALSGAADAGLVANVVDGTNYNAFREWAARVKGANGAEAVGAQTVKESAKAWLSYALGSDRLIAKEITSNDVHVMRFAVDDGAATGGSRSPVFAFEVAIDGVNIGGGSVTEVVLKENLKKVLGIEGAASLTPSAFSSDNITITLDTPVDGKAKFTASPPSDVGDSFFMRVKIK